MELKQGNLEIQENNGYKNIYPKGYPKQNIKGLEDNEYIEVEKIHESGKPHEGKYGKFYSFRVKYKDENVGFLLNTEEDNLNYTKTGPAGIKIRIIANKYTYTNHLGQEVIGTKLRFEPITE